MIAIRERTAVAGLIAISFVLRTLAAIPHSTPRLFPDEYIYAELARSLRHGRLTIRGVPAHFPALLEPILAAPFWLLHSVDEAFRLTQAMHSLVGSLVAVPVWLLARRLGLGAWQRLSCVVLTLALPTLLYASYLTADVVAFTLALAAVHAAVNALEAPTRRSQMLFLTFAGLATFARVQYVVIAVAFCVAALVRSSGRPFAAIRRYRFTALALGVPTVAVAGLGPGRVLGYYRSVLGLDVHLVGMASWAGSDLMLLVYASGFVLVPAALVGLALGVTRPRDPAERSFATFVAAFTGLLLIEASLYAANGTGRFQERYLMALLPLVPLLFFLGMRRVGGRGARNATVLLALALLLLAARVPLSGYVVGFGSQDSPILQAVSEVESLTSIGTGSLLIALIAALLSLLAVGGALLPRRATAIAVAGAVAVLVGASVATVTMDAKRTRRAQALFSQDPSWIDHSGLQNVALLVTPGNLRAASSARMFWNSSVTRLLQMSGADPIDAFGSTPARIGPTGAITVPTRALSTPFAVEEYASDVELTGSRLVRRTVGASLWVPAGIPRLSMLTYGRYLDGWLAWPRTRITIWPTATGPRRGVLCLDLSVPRGVESHLTLRAAGVRRDVALRRGTHEVLAIPVVARRPWSLEIGATAPLVADGRPVSAMASRPRFIAGKASATTCR